MGDQGSAFYELVDGVLTISASVGDVYHSLAITEMVSDQWFRQEPAGYDIEDGQPNFGMTTEEVLALDMYDIETWPGFFDLDVAQEFYQAYYGPSLDGAELLARLNSAAAHVYANVDNTRHHTPPIAEGGNYPLYLSEEHANGAMEGDGTSHPMNVNGMTYWMPNGAENPLPVTVGPDFESDNYGPGLQVVIFGAPTSGDPMVPFRTRCRSCSRQLWPMEMSSTSPGSMETPCKAWSSRMPRKLRLLLRPQMSSRGMFLMP